MARKPKAAPAGKAVLYLIIGMVLGWQLGEQVFDGGNSGPTISVDAPAPTGTGGVPGSAFSEIHARHFLYGPPTGTPATNDLILREAYALSSNDETKFADWVAFYMDRASVSGSAQQSRQWRSDPWLEDRETLEPADYKGAYEQLDVDRGHQAPLASFRGLSSWAETNYLSNITPQKSDLNQGPWRIMEEKMRDVAERYDGLYVLTGPLYERTMPALPNADEPHRIPSGYWSIAVRADGDALQAASFLFDQDTPGNAQLMDHLVAIDEIERRSGLDFFRDLPDAAEARLEQAVDRAWAAQHFD